MTERFSALLIVEQSVTRVLAAAVLSHPVGGQAAPGPSRSTISNSLVIY